MAKTTAAKFNKLTKVPAAVREFVTTYCNQYHLRNITANVVTDVYIDEDARYNVFFNGEWRSFQAMGEWSGFATSGMASTTNQRMPLPQGAWVVETQIFLGKRLVNVYGAGLVALGAGN